MKNLTYIQPQGSQGEPTPFELAEMQSNTETPEWWADFLEAHDETDCCD